MKNLQDLKELLDEMIDNQMQRGEKEKELAEIKELSRIMNSQEIGFGTK